MKRNHHSRTGGKDKEAFGINRQLPPVVTYTLEEIDRRFKEIEAKAAEATKAQAQRGVD